MDLEALLAALDGRGTIRPPAEDGALRRAERELSVVLPEQLASLLRLADGFLLHDGTSLFSTEGLVERNSTLEVREYLPGYVAVGDDSGGQAYVLKLGEGDTRIYTVGVGDMSADGLTVVAADLASWIGQDGFGCVED